MISYYHIHGFIRAWYFSTCLKSHYKMQQDSGRLYLRILKEVHLLCTHFIVIKGEGQGDRAKTKSIEHGTFGELRAVYYD